mgnify:CR=1 FL=1
MDYSLIPFLFVLLISFVIGCFFSKSSKKQSDYFLGGRSLGWPLLTMTFAATQIGGGFILGTADAAAEVGPFAILFPLGYCLGFLALGAGFGEKLRCLKLDTASDVFERYYNSILLKKITSILSIVSLTVILVAQAVALKKFLFSMGWADEWIFLLAWSVVILYTTQGGFLAVVWTDTVQAVVMVVMLIVAFFFTMGSAPTDTTTSLTLFSSAQWDLAEPKILGYLLMPFLFIFIEQDMVQRCFAAKSKRDVAIGGLLAALVLFILAIIPVYFGMQASALQIEGEKSSKFMEAVSLLTNKGITACAASAVLLAIISTASSLLSAASSNIAQDFTKNKEKLPIRRTKLITLFTGIIALVGAYTATNVLSCIIVSYELFVACLFVPFVFAVFFRDKCLTLLPAAILSVIFGLSGFVLVKFVSFGMWGELLPICSSALGFGLGYVYVKLRSSNKESLQLAETIE